MYNHDIVNLDNPNNFVIRQTYFGLIFWFNKAKKPLRPDPNSFK